MKSLSESIQHKYYELEQQLDDLDDRVDQIKQSTDRISYVKDQILESASFE